MNWALASTESAASKFSDNATIYRVSAFCDLTAERHCISSVVSAPKFRSAALTRHEYYSLERGVYSRDIDRWTICCKSTWATNVQYNSYFMAICLQVGYYSPVNAKQISLLRESRKLPSFSHGLPGREHSCKLLMQKCRDANCLTSEDPRLQGVQWYHQ